MTASFDLINYATRPNKSVERKMITETLAAVGRTLPMADYRYVGFGSMWFTDFILMHRVLDITDMISIENKMSRKDRANFNRPFGCVRVEMGDSTKVLPTLNWGDRRAICWLDYDKPLNESHLADVDFVCRAAISGSVLLVTVNADHRNLQTQDRKSPSDRLERLREIAGDAVPTDASPIDKTNSPLVLAATLENQIRHSLRQAARGIEYVPLFNFQYADGALMITVGGLLLDAADASSFDAVELRARLPFVTAPNQYEIAVPHLTLREKLLLDQRLPVQEEEPEELPFTMGSDEIAAYRSLYRFYPYFSELYL